MDAIPPCTGQEEISQYSVAKILAIWAAAAVPMGILGWVVAPALAKDPEQPGFERLAILTIGLVWQFIGKGTDTTVAAPVRRGAAADQVRQVSKVKAWSFAYWRSVDRTWLVKFVNI